MIHRHSSPFIIELTEDQTCPKSLYIYPTACRLIHSMVRSAIGPYKMLLKTLYSPLEDRTLQNASKTPVWPGRRSDPTHILIIIGSFGKRTLHKSLFSCRARSPSGPPWTA